MGLSSLKPFNKATHYFTDFDKVQKAIETTKYIKDEEEGVCLIGFSIDKFIDCINTNISISEAMEYVSRKILEQNGIDVGKYYSVVSTVEGNKSNCMIYSIIMEYSTDYVLQGPPSATKVLDGYYTKYIREETKRHLMNDA